VRLFYPMLTRNQIFSAVLCGICALSSMTASARLGNWPEYDQLEKAEVVALFSADDVSADNSSRLLDFVLLQKGSFQGNLLIAIAKYVPEARLPDIAQLMRKSRHNLVRYGCFKVINYRLNGGRGICGIDGFNRHPDRFLEHAEQLLKAQRPRVSGKISE